MTRVWEKFGLLSPRFFDTRSGDPRYASLPRANRFRMALEELGGSYLEFGRYLAGRADLLPSPHLRQLNRLPALRRGSQQRALEAELANRVQSLEFLRAAPAAELYGGVFLNRPVVIEFHPTDAAFSREGDWRGFCRSIKQLDDGPEGHLGAGRVLDRFREWLTLANDVERKRRIVANLEGSPPGSVWSFPRLVPDLQSPRCLAYDGSGGEPLEGRLQEGDEESRRALSRWAEGLLEASLLLSLVDAEMQLRCYALLPDGRMGFRSLPVFSPVPVEWSYELLQYVASTVGGHSVRALQMLSRISSNQDVYAGEQHLMRQLSSLQPELKINVITPTSVAALENQWRALAATHLVAPAFLELFHRQWTLVGQYNGELAPSADLLAESTWPVIGRVIRHHVSENMTAEKVQEWVTSSGLLLLSSARQGGMILEQIRDNDLAMLVDRQEYEPRSARFSRRTISLVRSAIALAVFLVSVQLALGARVRAAQIVAGIVAALAAIALSFFVARIE